MLMCTPAESAASTNTVTRVKEASHRPDTCNVVIFGETGVGKSSVVNLITGGRVPEAISPDAMGYTAETTVYDHDITIQDGKLKVKLFDTPGLGEGSEGTVPADEAQKVLKKLLQKLKEQDGIHLFLYCVRGARKTITLRRNYDIFRSRVKDVPIVLVVTGLENQEPDMDEWWKKNENFLSDQRLTFAGHACITALTLRDDDGTRIKERHKESYLSVCKLIEQCRLPSGKGVHDMGGIGDHHAMDRPRNVIVCDSAISAPVNVCNIAGVTNRAWVRSMVTIRGQYYMFQRVSAPYPPAERSKQGIGFEPSLLIFYVDKDDAVNAQKAEVKKFREVYAKFNVGLVVVVCGSDSDEDANSWWNGSSVGGDQLFGTSTTFRLTYLPREASGSLEGTQHALQGLIWELSRDGKPRDSVVRDFLNLVWRILTWGGGN